MLRAVLSSLIVLLCSRVIEPNNGQAALYIPPMELRPIPIEQSPIAFNLQHGRNLPITTFQNQLPASQATGASAIDGKRLTSSNPHSEPINSVFRPPIEQKHKESNFNSMHDLMEELGISEHPVDPEHDSRTAESYESRHYPSYSNYEYARPHEYSRPHGYWEPAYGHDDDDSYAYEPPPPSYYPHHAYHPYAPPLPKPVVPKPLLPTLPKPAPIKPLALLPSLPKPDLSSKLPLLLSIVQRLLGLPATGSGLMTLTTTLNTVLTPLLGSGTNIKRLLGKLLVPIIVLVLVNVEVLALTWWLWEDCSKVAPAPAAAPAYKPAPHPDYSYYYRTALNSATPRVSTDELQDVLI